MSSTDLPFQMECFPPSNPLGGFKFEPTFQESKKCCEQRRSTAETTDIYEDISLNSERKEGVPPEPCWNGWLLAALKVSLPKRPALESFHDKGVDESVPSPISMGHVERRELTREGSHLVHQYPFQREYSTAIDLELRGMFIEALNVFINCKSLASGEFDLGRVEYKIGAVMWSLGLYEESLVELQRSLRTFELAGDLVPFEDIVRVHLAIARVYLSQEDARRAKRSLKNACRIVLTNDPFDEEAGQGAKVLYAKILSSFGEYYTLVKDVEKANRDLQSAIQLLTKLVGRCHLDVATSLLSLGSLYELNHQYEYAAESYLEALDIYDTLGQRKCVGVATALSRTGWLHFLAGNYGSALEDYEHAMNALCPSMGANRNTAAIKVKMGMVYLQQRNHAQALTLFKEGLEGYRLVLSDRQMDVANVLFLIASTYERTNRSTKALRYYRKALRTYEWNGLDENNRLFALTQSSIQSLEQIEMRGREVKAAK